jgi:hypothetical protein
MRLQPKFTANLKTSKANNALLIEIKIDFSNILLNINTREGYPGSKLDNIAAFKAIASNKSKSLTCSKKAL